MIGKVKTFCFRGYDTFEVCVEASILHGPMQTQVVGLGDNAVKESKERMRAAILNSGFQYPTQHIIMNLAPNDRPKEGAGAELAMAVAILLASGQVTYAKIKDLIFLGSLSLDGSVHAPRGLINCVIEARRTYERVSLAIPKDSIDEVVCIPDISIYPLSKLSDLHQIKKYNVQIPNVDYSNSRTNPQVDMSEIIGQERAKYGLIYGALGKHHTLLIGAPGTGKTMLARALEDILPPLNIDQALETTQIYSSCGLINGEMIKKMPFRSPHHTTSDVALVGGGRTPRPGEASLAHNGVLFLDELLEFNSKAIQALREPLEEKKIVVSRAKSIVTFPADFILIAATNPCQCGYRYSNKRSCICEKASFNAKFRKIAGPFLDRISIEIETTELSKDIFNSSKNEKNSNWWFDKMMEAKSRMYHRNGVLANGQLGGEQLMDIYQRFSGWRKISDHYTKLHALNHRGYANALRLALTIMDFKETSSMTQNILEEAFRFQSIASIQKSFTELVA